MNDSEMTRLTQKLRDFADEREWNQFHDPKNLSMALVVEAGELVEIFQWLTSDQATSIMDDPKKADAVKEELADVYGYLLRLADNLGVSLNEALEAKIKVNAEKYPVEQARGSATKYNKFTPNQTHRRIVAVDWSGKKSGAASSIFTSEASTSDGRLTSVQGGRNRRETVDEIIAMKSSSANGLVVGFDFSFSFPSWFVEDLGCTTARDVWELADERGETWLADVEPPFWGWGTSTKPALPGEEFRQTEARLLALGATPKSVFQIRGPGSVGTGSIRGMPYLKRLSEAGFSIWPFDPPSPWMVVEIYPRILTGPVVKSDPLCRKEFIAGMGIPLVEAHEAQIARSEDAFDSAVSALVMARHATGFADLVQADDAMTRLEGRIWEP